jgi:hypothetical protein
MGLEKKALCRVVIKSPDGKKQFWSGSYYEDVRNLNVDKIIDRIKQILDG